MLPSERGRARRPAQGNRIPAHIHHQIIELVLEQSDLSQREAASEPCAAPAQDVGPLQFDHASAAVENAILPDLRQRRSGLFHHNGTSQWTGLIQDRPLIQYV